MGGSSAINTLAAIRGIPEDFDLWEQRGGTAVGENGLPAGDCCRRGLETVPAA
jgi:choline dehydrogenase-like flavoprotein